MINFKKFSQSTEGEADNLIKKGVAGAIEFGEKIIANM